MAKARDPFRELLALQDRMNKMFEDSMKSLAVEGPSASVWGPSVDVGETADTLILKLSLPHNVDPERIQTQYKDGVLIVQIAKKEGADPDRS
jgi:HSP20 family molecular chaperone IbpA